ncbi:hypothetical protein EVAR_40192_1 [Eumeta japonica]|uniref:Uncharacterized protein n=1 Tax=Eumeta variegata TaxID=151549 RepID=A0A4C1XJI7_EUMVA|nr:hypothetical protein EVAR_40192_1 [Eumeta japonica]
MFYFFLTSFARTTLLTHTTPNAPFLYFPWATCNQRWPTTLTRSPADLTDEAVRSARQSPARDRHTGTFLLQRSSVLERLEVAVAYPLPLRLANSITVSVTRFFCRLPSFGL